jgi:hypothetical protein
MTDLPPHDLSWPLRGHSTNPGGTAVTNRQIVRQGDVLLVPVDSIPKGASTIHSSVEGRNVLAYGEVTGHHHSVAVADSELVSAAEQVYLRIMSATTLDHQEHGSIALAPGNYRVVRQREYRPDALPVQVAD